MISNQNAAHTFGAKQKEVVASISNMAIPSTIHPHLEFMHSRPYLPMAQQIIIDDINLEQKQFSVATNLTIVVLDPDIVEIELNLGKRCLLPNEVPSFSGMVTVNEIEANFKRLEQNPANLPEGKNRSLSALREAVELFETTKRGDFIIEIPHEVRLTLQRNSVLRVHIDTFVRQPTSGVHFVLNYNAEGKLDETSHMYTYKSSFECSTSEWVPCFDNLSMFCVFDILIRVSNDFSAVASGEHNDTKEIGCGRYEYFFRQLVPTTAANIGFAIGWFQPYIHPDISDVMFLCPTGYTALMKHTVAQIGRVFEFFEELLSARFPFPSLHMLFVYNLPDDFESFASFSILSIDLLYHKKVIDVVQSSRKQIVNAIASQFFGCFVQPQSYHDTWLTKALARFITFLYIERAFGQCEYIYEFYITMREVCDYENRFGKICLSPRKVEDIIESYSNPTCPSITSPKRAEMTVKKGQLVMRMLHNRLGKEAFMKVLHRLIYVATHYGHYQQKQSHWYLLTITTPTFFQTVLNVTGREVPTLIEQWIHGGGHAYFEVSYQFNRKRNMIELEVKQELKQGRLLYTGPLAVVVQEIDGSYPHTVQIDKELVRDDIQCHSKGRNKKKKKVLLSIGEEVEVDFARFDPDATVLWIRVDPEMLLIRELVVHQPLIHYEYMVLYERDVCAQLNAIELFKSGSTVQTIDVLNDVITNEKFFYQVRVHALKALAHARTKFCEAISNAKSMIELFQEFYGSKSAPHILMSNNIVIVPKSLQKYVIMQHFARALAIVRDSQARCPAENIRFLASLLLYNDNSTNRFVDDFLRASFIEALGWTLTHSELNLPDLKHMDELVRIVVDETTRTLNLDMMKPSYGRCVQIACLKVICELQRYGHIPMELEFFWMYTDAKTNYIMVRIAAIECIIKLIRNQNRSECFVNAFFHVVDFIIKDSDPKFVYMALTKLTEAAPFHYLGEAGIRPSQFPINSEMLMELIWSKLIDSNVEERVRLLLMDLFFVFYGREIPETYVDRMPVRPMGSFTHMNGHR